MSGCFIVLSAILLQQGGAFGLFKLDFVLALLSTSSACHTALDSKALFEDVDPFSLDIGMTSSFLVHDPTRSTAQLMPDCTTIVYRAG